VPVVVTLGEPLALAETGTDALLFVDGVADSVALSRGEGVA